MNIKGLERLVIDRTDPYNENEFNRNVARVIRTKRLESNKTQSEIAKGICSVSYISKIENGECPPDNFFVREVMSRMGITLDEVMISEFTTELYEIMCAVYDDDVHKIQLLLDLTEKTDAIAAKLIQIVGRSYLGENVFERLEYINVFKNDLTDFELMVYMFCIAKHEASLLHYKKARQYLLIIQKFSEIHHHLEFLVYYALAETEMYIGEYVSALHYLRNAKKYIDQSYEIHNQHRVNLLYAEIMIHTGQIDHAEEELMKFTRIHKIDLEEKLHLLKGLIDYHNEDFNQSVNHFLKAKNFFFEEALLFIIRSFSALKEEERVLEYSMILEEGTNSMFFLKMSEYYKVKMDENIYAVREFINTNLLSSMKKFNYAYLNDALLEELIAFHRHNSRYKAIDELRTRLSIR